LFISSSLFWGGELVHDIRAYDCQPLMGTDRSSILVTVHGSVAFAGKPSKPFTQTFILNPDTSKKSYFVGSDCFRIV